MLFPGTATLLILGPCEDTKPLWSLKRGAIVSDQDRLLEPDGRIMMSAVAAAVDKSVNILNSNRETEL